MKHVGRTVLAGTLALATAAGLALPIARGDEPVAQVQKAEAPKVEPMDRPEPMAGVLSALSAAYLTPEEAKDRRVFFGQWVKDDLDTVQRAARAALLRGAYDDPALRAADADVLDRADAALARGDAKTALDLTKDQTGLRALRIKAEALEAVGRFAEAVGAAQPALERLAGARMEDPGEVVEAAHLVTLRIRLAGPGTDGAGKPLPAAAGFHALMGMLGEVRTKIDRLYWPAALAEAELLYAKDNKPKAHEALLEVLSMNPSCARAWMLVGRLAVDGFNFDQAEAVAARLDLIAGDTYEPDEEGTPERGASVLGAEVVARAMLRQIDGSQAQSVLVPALAKMPKRPQLLALMAAAEAVKFDERGLAARLNAFDAEFPGSPLAEFEVGRAFSEARQYPLAVKHFEEATKRQAFAPEPLIELGLVAVQAAQDDRALGALERAFELDPFNARADNSLRLVREMRTYERIETPHFVIRYKGVPEGTASPDALLAREMPEVLERNHAIVTGPQAGGIDHQLPEGTKTYIDLMPDHAWFAVRIAGMPQIHTIAASTGPLIAMESPREGTGHFGLYDWPRVLRHEYVHTVTLSRSNNRIPHWFTEAASVHLEQAPRDYPTCQMLARAVDTGELFDFSYINVAFVRPKKPSDRSFAYAQGEWMYSYMIEAYGPKSPLELLDEYAKGLREEEAFQRVLKVSRSEFFESFKTWAKVQAQGWGLVRKSDQPSIGEMLKAEAGAAPEGEQNAPTPTREMVDRWLAKYPDHPDVLELAMELSLAKNAGAATPMEVPLILRYARARPVDPKPHRLLAKMYLDAAAADPAALGTQAARAIPHLEHLDAREDKSPVFAMELARRYAAVGEWAKATAAGVRATRLSPFDARVREAAATVAVQAKDYDLAERQLKALALIEPTREVHAKRLEALRKLRSAGAK